MKKRSPFWWVLGMMVWLLPAAAWAQADLSMNSWSLSTSTARGFGSAVNITYNIRNSGNQNAGTFEVGFYYTDNAGFATTTRIGTATINSLNAGQNTGNRTLRVTLPNNVLFGNRFIHYSIDYNRKVAETNENNNNSGTILNRPLGMAITGLPDLRPFLLNVSPTTQVAGGTLTVSVRIFNYGYSRTSLGSGTQLYYSTNNTYQATDTALGSPIVTPVLNARSSFPASANSTLNVTVPGTATTGTRYILAYADRANTVNNESNENNNVLARAFTVVANKPELAMAAWSAPASSAGYPNNITITYNVRNSGGANAGTFYVAFYYSDTPTSTQTYIGRATVAGLNANSQTGSRTISLQLPRSVLFGSRQLHYRIDYLNNVSEANETNNEGRRALQITGRPNLQVTYFVRSPTSQVPGGDIRVTVGVQNTGASRITGTTIAAFYLSVNNTIGPGDVRFPVTLTIPALDAGRINYQSTDLRIPTNTPGSGTRYIIARADDGRTVTESNEGDNDRAVSFTLTSGIADLAMTTWTSPNSAVGYQSNITVSYEVENRGNTNAGAFRLTFYYGNSSGTSGLVTLRNVDITGLNAGAKTSGSVTITLPGQVQNGARFIHYFIDSQNRIPELRETNNRGSRAIQITGQPNLQVSVLSVTPASQIPGGQLQVTYRIANVGRASTSTNSFARLYYSTDSTITTGDTFLSTISMGLIAAGASYPSTANGTRTVVVPSSATAGVKYIGAIADYSSRIVESSETDNTRSAPFTVITSIPDLQMASWTVSPTSTAGSGDTITVRFSLRNAGNANAGAFKVQFYYNDSTSSTGLTALGTAYSSTGVNAGQTTSTLTYTGRLPATVLLGTRYIHYFIDSDNAVAESNETNNRNRRTIAITGRPNLQVSVLSVTPASQARNGQLQVTYRVVNAGKSRTATYFYLRFYYSNDSTITTGDTYRTQVYIARLDAGASYPASGNGTVTVTVPSNAPLNSTRYIGAIADYSGRIAETSEADNTRSAAFRVIGSIPDLYMAGWSRSPTSISSVSTPITLSFRVRNNGSAAAGAFTLTFYYGDTAARTNLVEIGKRTYTGLAARTTDSTRTLQVTLPSSALSGTRYIHYFVDSAAAVNELYETNNRGQATITIAGPPDLNPTVVSVSPTTQQAGQSIKVDYTIFNRGAANAASFRVGIYFSLDATIDATDTLLHNFTLTNLASNSSTTGSRTFNLPTSTTGGKGYIGIFADDDAKVSEFNENNNTASTAFEALVDKDNDGVPSNVDCDDNDKDRFPAHNGKPANKEVCDGKDNDCNGQVDDGITCSCTNGQTRQCYTGSAGCTRQSNGSYNCTTPCKAGTQTCTGGQWTPACTGEVISKAETCDGTDEDCNGKVDDNLTRKCYTGAAGTAGVGECKEGTQACVNGSYETCKNEVVPAAEVCDGKDNNCDGQVDNAAACQEKGSEPLPEPTTDAGTPPEPTSETPGESDCYTSGCPSGEVCKNGQCTTDPCDGVSCQSGEFCRDGNCVKACGCTQCPAGESCVDGSCQSDACKGVTCASGEACDPSDGSCKQDPCASVTCGTGRVCQAGSCVDDPCNNVQCPTDMECKKGQCVGKQCGGEPTGENTGENTGETTSEATGETTSDGGTDGGDTDATPGDQGGSDQANTDNAGEQGSTDRGGSDQGSSDTGGNDSSSSDKGTTDQGSADAGDGEKVVGGDGTGGDGSQPPPAGCCQTGSNPQLPTFLLMLFVGLLISRRRRRA